jgi:hypothetical protein
VHDSFGPQDQFVEVECRMHAIGYRRVEVKALVGNANAPEKAGTWYLITLKELEWKRNPMWIHEDDSRLNLGYLGETPPVSVPSCTGPIGSRAVRREQRSG